MPRGVRLPRGRVFAKYEGDDRRRRLPFDLSNLAEKEVDPSEWEPRWEISERKRMAEVNPEQVLEDISLHDLLRIWTNRYAIFNSSGKHELFEIFCHLVFPAKEERTLAYIAIWHVRDKLTFREIARRLGSRGCIKISTHTVRKYVEYVESRIYNFTRRTKFKEKFKAELLEELQIEEAQTLEEDVREIVGG